MIASKRSMGLMLPFACMRLNELSVTEAARRIERGEITAEALVCACLDRIAERDESVRAWAHIDRARVIEEARALDGASRESVLHGIPFGIKDSIDTADMP